jgi:lipase maturation factor 1
MSMGHALLRRWYLRGIAAVSVIAFVSLWVQVHGLVGKQGVLPYPEFLRRVAQSSQVGEAFWRAPTVMWWLSAEWGLDLLCVVGIGASCCVFFRVLEGPALLLGAACYLSLSTVGQVFLSFQWDTLLVETLVVASFVAGWGLRAEEDLEPSWTGLWLQRWLCFRLLFFGGLVKLLSGDESWRDGSAMGFHYVTQPLPNPLSWYAHHLPAWWHSLEGAVTLGLEIILPVIMVFGRWPRAIVWLGASLLMAALFLTGNYGFFQLLSLVLCFSLLDDGFLGKSRLVEPVGPSRFGLGAALLFGGMSLVVIHQQMGRFRVLGPLPIPSIQALEEDLHARVRPFRVVNSYGLFATMTRSQPELIFEGSEDGETWLPYGFAYKQGELARRPVQVAPHMPRLDWQLWFAALSWRAGDGDWSACRRHSYVRRVQEALFRGNEAVLGLFGEDPFSKGPPRHVRVQTVAYGFTDWRTEGADWWTAEPLGLFCPTLSR